MENRLALLPSLLNWLNRWLVEKYHQGCLMLFGESRRTYHRLPRLAANTLTEPELLIRTIAARVDLRRRYPLGLTPGGRRDLLDWVRRHGEEHDLTLEDAIADLQVLEARPDHGIVLSYQLQPAWQKLHPLALTPIGWNAFRDWLAEYYQCPGQWLREAQLDQEDQWQPNVIDLGVNIIAPWRYVCGLQVEAEQIAQALQGAGYAIAKRALPAPPILEGIDSTEHYRDLETYPITLVKTGAMQPFDGLYPNIGLDPRPGVYRIAAWSWELEEFPSEPIAQATLANEFWTPSAFAALGLRQVVGNRPVKVMPPGLQLPEFPKKSRRDFRLPQNSTMFLSIFDLSGGLQRKNPLGLIRAFEQAFPADANVSLVLKINRALEHPEQLRRVRQAANDPRIHLLLELLPRQELLGLFELCDSYVSLHRSEGFGYTVAEAMMLGKAVISTDYSATTEFLNEENGLPVRYQKVSIIEAEPPYPVGAKWAEPDSEHAAERMRWVYENPLAAKKLGEHARTFANSHFCPKRSAKRMTQRLETIRAEMAQTQEAQA